jgi:hypothetical protein
MGLSIKSNIEEATRVNLDFQKSSTIDRFQNNQNIL